MAIFFHFQILTIFSLIALLQAQDQPAGFISIDCGLPSTTKNYTDPKTKLLYVSDSGFIETGVAKSIANEYTTYNIDQQLQNLRTFPEGDRICYEIQLTKGTKYLIRAIFMYGNHDSKNEAPIFDLYIGSKKWDTVNTLNATMIITKEIIHLTTSNYIYVCLVNTETGSPFISTLELRPITKNNSYNTDFGSLSRFVRLDVGSSVNLTVRYPDDIYDRIWMPYHFLKWADISTLNTVDLQAQNNFRVPSIVMRSAGVSKIPDEPMQLFIDMEDNSLRFLVYMHFAEIVELMANESRIFNISLNSQPWFGPVKLDYLYTTTVFSPSLLTGGKYEFSLFKVQNSTLPPLLNGIEIFSVVDLSQTLSNQGDVEAIKSIRKLYEINRNWQGDPCAQEFLWDGLNCSYSENDVPRIISLNLSSIGLTGEIPLPISRLTSLESLDLSNNNLTGSVPDFLSQLSSLKVLNLSGNNLSGSVPGSLIEKSNKKTLDLSVGGNPNLCASSSCKSTKKSKAVPIVASIVGVIILIAALATLFYILKRRKQKGATFTFATKEEGKNNSEREALEPKGRSFTYSEVVSMTNNFQRVLGKGGFGTVYHGYLDDTQVAVKILSQSSAQGYKEFRTEVRLLLRVHHRNLTSLVGFCDEGTVMGLIYEYMANGDMENLFSGSNRNAFGWDRRLQVVVEAAQGLEYLHNGCKPPIVHRDIKPANILLNDKFQAKLADFGLSRSFPIEGGSHISTVIAGTPGYLDPEYSVTNWLTEKSDVYSFGIVLLKTITGRAVIAMENGRNIHICQYVKSLLENGDIKNIVDQSLGDDFDVNSLWKAVEIAMACASPTSDGRPTMQQVVTELSQSLAEEIARKKQGNQTDSSGSMSEDITSNSYMTETFPLAR